jgi:hypothetical protein
MFLGYFCENVKVKEMRYPSFIQVCCVVLVLMLFACANDQASGQIEGLGKSPEQPFPVNRNDAKGKIPAFNEASLEPSLAQYIDKLSKAVADKDVDYLMSVIEEDTRFSFGDGSGKEEFMKFWKLDKKPSSSPIWATLKDVLSLSGGFYGLDREMFVAPYYFAIWPQDYAPASHGVIVGDSVSVRDSASINATEVTMLSYDIVMLTGDKTTEDTRILGNSYPWHEIMTLSGQPGWVYGKFFRSPQGYRIGFKQTDGKWRIVFFVGGD